MMYPPYLPDSPSLRRPFCLIAADNTETSFGRLTSQQAHEQFFYSFDVF